MICVRCVACSVIHSGLLHTKLSAPRSENEIEKDKHQYMTFMDQHTRNTPGIRSDVRQNQEAHLALAGAAGDGHEQEADKQEFINDRRVRWEKWGSPTHDSHS